MKDSEKLLLIGGIVGGGIVLGFWTRILERILVRQLHRGFLVKDVRTKEISGFHSNFWMREGETWEHYEQGLQIARNLGFNTVRFFTSKIATTEFDTSAVNRYLTLLNSYGFKIIPVFFNDNSDVWRGLTLEEQKRWIDLWVERVDETKIVSWQILNEPRNHVYVDSQLPILTGYLKSKTQKPVSIGFHHPDNEHASVEKFEALIDLIDFHYYPYAYPVRTLLNPWFNLHIDFENKLQWLNSFSNPFIIGEFGLPSRTTSFTSIGNEKAQHDFHANLLHLMKEDSNLNGYCVFQLKDPHIPTQKFWGIHTQDYSPKQCVYLFP